MNKKIAVVDTYASGHHLEYVYGVCKQIKNKNVDVYCNGLISKYVAKNDLPQPLNLSQENIYTNVLKEPAGNWYEKTKQAYHNIIKLKDYDEIIFLAINVYLLALIVYALFHKKRFRVKGIYFNPFLRNTSSYKKKIKELTFRILLKKFTGSKIYLLNDEVAAQKLNVIFSKKVFSTLRDPIPTFYYDGLSDNYTKGGKRLNFLLIGSISKRKGVFELLNAIKVSESDNNFYIIGRIDTSIKEKFLEEIHSLKKDGFNIFIEDKFLDNAEFARYIYKSDVILMPYLTTGASSGILGHAAYAKKPVIGPNKGLLSKLISEYKLGMSIDPKGHKKLGGILRQKKIDFFNEDAKEIDLYINKHSWKNFTEELFS